MTQPDSVSSPAQPHTNEAELNNDNSVVTSILYGFMGLMLKAGTSTFSIQKQLELEICNNKTYSLPGEYIISP